MFLKNVFKKGASFSGRMWCQTDADVEWEVVSQFELSGATSWTGRESGG